MVGESACVLLVKCELKLHYLLLFLYKLLLQKLHLMYIRRWTGTYVSMCSMWTKVKLCRVSGNPHYRLMDGVGDDVRSLAFRQLSTGKLRRALLEERWGSTVGENHENASTAL